MTCDIPRVQLYLYLDGELDTPEAMTIERHLQECEICQKEASSHQNLRSLLRSTLTREDVPEHLWASVKRQLPIPAESPKEPPKVVRPARWLIRNPLWAGAGALAALLLLSFSMQLWFDPPVAGVVQEIVDSQIRAKLMGMSYQRVPADAGSIRRWFNDKVAFSVLVPDVSDARFTFQGVRLNYFLNRRVAEIAYTSRSHMLSFLMFSDKDVVLKRKRMRTVRVGKRSFYVQRYKGYNTVLWKDGDAFCSLVSDLRLAVLLQLAGEATGSSSAS